jgi:hypothetical protein
LNQAAAGAPDQTEKGEKEEDHDAGNADRERKQYRNE